MIRGKGLSRDKGVYQVFESLEVLDAATFKTVVESIPLSSIDLCLPREGRLFRGLCPETVCEK